MGRITVLHTADLHLGASFKGLPPQTGRQRRKDLMQTLARIIEICRQSQVDLLLISGDLWDEQYVTRPLVDFIADQFRRIPTTSIVISPGQADYCHGNSFYCEYPWPGNVHVFQASHLTSVDMPHLNTRVYGLAWTDAGPPEYPDWTELSSSGCQNVIIAHRSLEDLAIPQEVLDSENLVYVALGGAHKHKVWSDKIADPGSPEPLISDSEKKGVLVGSIAPSQLELTQVQSRQWVEVQVDITDCRDGDEIIAKIRDNLASVDSNNIFSVTLVGQRPLNWSKDQVLLDGVFHLNLVDATEVGHNAEALLTEHSRGVIGKYIAAVKDSHSNDSKEKRALAYGLDALLSGRVAPW